ncbi:MULTISPECIES: hypothetical protein [Aliivibrio]|uniref:Uncharacterized protein n=1 Tax=Aliivibrio finisterrensis TaxID=511998 RepID=A0A4Q5KL64_9GAMM|nr:MULTISPECIES: hypothetical protein [Aliivibrio]MDD9180681.1 hypothetical protein [Aliivibrio sp. A6]RYU47100.1 hypothetical protein ERW57_18750 [Aliivibrio finisterrensis]RYU47860.1 hypothetical protein ERW56_18915 [Aliivibrio finisterrensis]RYU53284.1 hypothetical protein ERW50_18635 [Aliivibrio finisterrensis]RYU59883.1 hypothetical protein ERW53_19720 [Aliivibrio finisterrensis]
MSNHKLTISGKNISIDEYVTPEFARKIIALLYSDSSSIIDNPQNIQTPQSDTKKTAPLAEKEDVNTIFTQFCKSHDVRRYCEIVLAVGIYLSEQGKEYFTIKDYRNFFEQLKGLKATNAPANIRWALDINWIADAGDNKYKVTAAGRRVLKEKFPDSVRGSTRGKPKR